MVEWIPIVWSFHLLPWGPLSEGHHDGSGHLRTPGASHMGLWGAPTSQAATGALNLRDDPEVSRVVTK